MDWKNIGEISLAVVDFDSLWNLQLIGHVFYLFYFG